MEIGRDELVVIVAFIFAIGYFICHRRKVLMFYLRKSENRRSQVEMELLLQRRVIKKLEIKYGIKELTSVYQEALQEFVKEMRIEDEKQNRK